MNDYGALYTDRKIKELDRRIKKIYSEAEQDIIHKMEDFNRKYKAKESKYAQQVKDGKITQEQFDKWKKGQVFQGKQWQAKKDQITEVLYNSNKIASQLINEERTDVFGVNFNYASYSMEKQTNVNFGFGVYDHNAVANLLENEPNLLPSYTPKRGIDKAWNSKSITRQITQGVIQGEKLDQIALRLAKATGSQNMNSMKTHVRTLMTAAQNAGRLESYKQATKLDIDVEKQWMATLDAHTRDSHRRVDGETQPLDREFSNGCMFPGDPGGPPKEVYNCRCTMVSDVKKYPAKYQRYDNIDGKPINNTTYREWEKAKESNRGGAPKKAPRLITVSPEQASNDWFEYENANAMREYIQTGVMPQQDLFGYDISEDKQNELMAEAELMQKMGSTTKTEHKTLYRGMVLSEEEAHSIFVVGENYTFETLSSTATDRGVAAIYTNVENSAIDNGLPVILEIQKGDGIYGFDRDGMEIIIPKGSEFRVTRNWMDEKGIVHISLYAKKGVNVI